MAGNVKVKILGDASDLQRAARQGEQSLDRLGKSGGRLRGGLASLGSVAAGGAALGIGALTVGLKESFTAYKESERIGRQTVAVIKSTGGAANVSAKDVGALASAISRKTAVDDEAIQSGANLLLTFKNVRNEAGKGNAIFDRTTKAAVDMAAALGSEPKQAAMQLGKALNDPTQGLSKLSRAGVQFSEQQKQQIKTLQESGNVVGAQKIMLRELESQFGGSAAATATNSARLKVTFGNLAETVGKAVSPAIEKGAAALDKFISGAMKGTGVGGRFVGTVRSIASGVGAFLGPIVSAAKGILGFGESTGKAGRTLSGFKQTASATFGAVRSIIASAVNTARRVISALAPVIEDLGKGAFRDLRRFANQVFPDVQAIVRQTARIVNRVLGGMADFVQSTVIPGLRRLLPAIRQIFNGALTVIRGVIKVIKGVLTGDFSEAWEGVKGIFRGGLKMVVGILRGGIANLRTVGGLLGKGVVAGMKAGLGALEAVGKGVLNSLIGIVNKGIGAINAATPGKIKVPGPVPDIPGIPDIPKVPTLAGGGRVPGARTAADTVPAMLSPKEFVVTEDGERRIEQATGIPGFLDMLGAVQRPHFANGGRVSGRGLKRGTGSVEDSLQRLMGVFPVKKFRDTEGDGGKKAASTGSLDRRFPRHFLDTASGKVQLTSEQVQGIARKVGLPARTFDLIAKGESGRYPGVQQRDPGDGMVGYGLWQMTPNAWGAGSLAMKKLASLGGIVAMFNPVTNGRMAKFLLDHAPSKTPGERGFPWYGIKYLARGGRVGGLTSTAGVQGFNAGLARRGLASLIGDGLKKKIVEVSGGKFASAPKKAASASSNGPASAGGVGSSRSKLQEAMGLARKAGLTITSTTGGKHATGSWHYSGRAFDASNGSSPTPQMAAFAQQAAGRYGSSILEMFYDGLPWYIKNGRKITGRFGGHSDHVHLALRRGGRVMRKGGKVANVRKLLASLSQGANPADALKALVPLLGGLSFSKLVGLDRRATAMANSDKTSAKGVKALQGALTLLDAQQGIRVGDRMGGLDALTSGFEEQDEWLSQEFSLNNTDPESTEGLAVRLMQDQGQLSTLRGRLRGQDKAVKMARRSGDPKLLAAAKSKRKQFRKAVRAQAVTTTETQRAMRESAELDIDNGLGARTSLAGLTADLGDDRDAAIAVRDRRQQQFGEAMRSGDAAKIAEAADALKAAADNLDSIKDAIAQKAITDTNAGIALAQLAKDKPAELAGLQRLQEQQTGILDEAKNSGDSAKIIDAANNLRGTNEAVEALTEAINGDKEQRERQLALDEEKVANQRKLIDLTQREGAAMMGALAAVISGEIGGRYNLGRQSGAGLAATY